jgi:hypothetical protein
LNVSWVSRSSVGQVVLGSRLGVGVWHFFARPAKKPGKLNKALAAAPQAGDSWKNLKFHGDPML